MRAPSRPTVLVVGPGPRSSGGVRAVIEALAASGLGERFELVEVATHRDGSITAKARVAARGLACVGVLLARGRVDLVYLHSASDASFWRKSIAAAMARAARRPYVVHIHGGGFVAFHDQASWPARAIVRWVLRGACTVVTLTPTWAHRIEAIAGRATEIIPNPVVVPSRTADQGRRPARVLSLARLGPAKGSLVLVTAFAALADRHPGATLTLAGDGDAGEVRALAARLGIADRVVLPGWVGPVGRDVLLGEAGVFALPSRAEGLPMGMLEAMAFGVPVIVTPVGGIPDVIEDGVTGLLVPVDDPDALAAALDRLLADPGYASRMGAAGRRAIAASCAIDTVAMRVGDVIDRGLGRHSGTAEPAGAHH